MRFVCLGRNQKFFEFLCQMICGEEDKFVFFADGLSLLRDIFLGFLAADLILLDWDFYKEFSDFIFGLFESKNLKIPMIFIGGELVGSGRICHWFSINEFQYDIQSLHPMIPTFQKIDAALESDEVKNLLSEKKFGESDIVELCRRGMILPPSVLKFFSFLWRNRRREVSLEEIARKLNLASLSEKSKKNAVYSYIARLRKYIKKISACELEIVRTRTGFYRLMER